MGEGHENAKYRLTVQALYGLFSVQVQTVNCLEQAVAAVSVPGILKMGSDTNTVWLHVVLLLLSHEISYLFFPLLDLQGLLLWSLELSEGAESRIAVEHLGCNVGVLARHEFEMAHC